MEYFVKGTDGKEYGPVGIDQLKQWITENRVYPNTQLRDFHTGQTILASSVPALFPQQAPPQANPYAYGPNLSPSQPYRSQQDNDVTPLIWVIVRAIGGMVFFFFLHGLGLVITGFGIFYAIQMNQRGNKYGVAAIIISIVAFIIVGVGWMLRLGGAGV